MRITDATRTAHNAADSQPTASAGVRGSYVAPWRQSNNKYGQM
jgi:hypothetical protein